MGNKTNQNQIQTTTYNTNNYYSLGQDTVAGGAPQMGYTGRAILQAQRQFNKRYGKAAKELQAKHAGEKMPLSGYVIGSGKQNGVI
jgi:hypothetical protein